MNRRNFLSIILALYASLQTKIAMTEINNEDVQLRSAKDVAQRCLALLAILQHSDKPQHKLISWVKENHIASYFSHEEKIFFETSKPTKKQLVKFSWRVEALVPLLWALGHIEKLPPLNVQASNLKKLPGIQLANDNPKQFVGSAKLRKDSVIQEAEEDLYNKHWRVRDAQLNHKAMPRELDPDIVFERRYGLSWLVGWGESWDDVPTDT